MNRRLFAIVIAIGLLLIPLALSQDTISPLIEPNDDTLVNPAANISFPSPVYVVRETVDIRGTVTLPTMRNFFIEFRPLVVNEADALPSEERPWFPATLPQLQPIVDDVLGTWNTFTAPDGLYELRLTINTDSGIPQYVRVSPIRVENDVPPFLQADLTQQAGATPIPTQVIPSSRETLAPTPTSLNSGQPQVVSLIDSNVRTGDSTEYDRIGFLFAGETASIIGISSFGTGWYYIQLSNGRRGWIAPSVVRTEGNLNNVPRINPPPPPTPIPTNTPTNTPTPVTEANLVINDVQLDPNPPVCNETYTLFVTVENAGTGKTSAGGTISVNDTRTSDGTVVESTVGAFPELEAGDTFQSFIPITVTAFTEEDHSVVIRIDSTNVVPETNESDNTLTIVYELDAGSC